MSLQSNLRERIQGTEDDPDLLWVLGRLLNPAPGALVCGGEIVDGVGAAGIIVVHRSWLAWIINET